MSYDARGRITAKTRTIDGVSRTIFYTYDSLDRVASCTYPDGDVVTKTYNPQGETAVSGWLTAYLSAAAFNEFNQITSQTFGNGIVTSYDYYDTSGELDAQAGNISHSYRLRNVVTSPASILNLSYGYDKAGNVKSRTDANNSNYSETYVYDDLDRLINAYSLPLINGYPLSGAYGNKTYAYDTVGNILAKDARSYSYVGGTNQVYTDG